MLNDLNDLEKSALCTNLARGCEKQYKQEESALFEQLAEWFREKSMREEANGYDELSALIDQDLAQLFLNANEEAAAHDDRGAKRALVWSEKVTKIQKSILSRYKSKGEALIENTQVYVCSICGFIYIGDQLPELCPICKVPNWKFEKI
ncbi:MAG: hypothetical protein PHQ55_04115 [Eubacteriales bacterium]|jgi:rubrerythrin|nr:hypothetical protein [Eubacteriales bacterium]